MEQDQYITDLQNTSLDSIYRTLSVAEDDDFDIHEEFEMIEQEMMEIYDDAFKHVDTLVLLGNVLLLNDKFVKLIKHMATAKNYRKYGYVFICFCDFFDLAPEKVYPLLHEKVQIIIKNSAKCICGVNLFNSVERKNSANPNLVVPSLLSMFKK